MKAWYFSDADRRLRYGDEREIKAGTAHTVDCEPVLCKSGLHGSVRPIDALTYAPGAYVWRVELGGAIVRGDDKCAATERTYLWGYDASKVLRHFARLCALDVIHLWDAPDVVVKWLKTGDESLRSAAYSAADSAADSAAYSADYSAAWSAAESAAWSAARSAAWSAADSAAWSAARSAQNRRLYRMLMGAKP